MASEFLNVDVPNLLIALGIGNWRENGNEIWAPCPLPGHAEKEPSWSIRWDADEGAEFNGYHHCFGCERSGGAVNLVREVIGLSSYGAARQWILDRKLTLDKAAPSKARIVLKGAAAGGLQIPRTVRQEPLEKWPTPARRYAESRNVTAAQVSKWEIGYGTSGSTTARIWLPTYDRNHVLVNWAARTFVGASPRFLNPDHTEGPDPESIFGEAHWPGNPAHCTLLLTEAELDALALERALEGKHRFGTFVGALGGSAVKGESFGGKLTRISQFTRIVLVMDADNAGNKAAAQIIRALARWKKVKKIALPTGMDVSDVERDQGLPALRRMIWPRTDSKRSVKKRAVKNSPT